MNERLLSALFSFRETGVCLAFSGGVDSTLLLALCVKEQIPVTAVTFQTTLHPRCDLENARAITKKLGVRHLVLEVDETAVPVIMENPPTAATTVRSIFSPSCKLWQKRKAAPPF